MSEMNDVVAAVHKAGIGLKELRKDHFARVRSAIGDARVVLIGEETHGTQEFYRLRAELTQALIEREGFSLVLCESDFPAFYKLHRFVGGTRASRESLVSSSSSSSAASPPRSPTLSSTASTPLLTADVKIITPSYGTAGIFQKQHDEELASGPLGPSALPPPRVTADEVMDALKERFPVWMWRNEVVRDFVEWLQCENLRRKLQTTTEDAPAIPVALFGLDIYSMFASTDQVISYLDTVDPAMAERARRRYYVLQQFRPHEEDYVRSVLSGRVPPQHNPIKRMVHELHDKAKEFKNVFGDGDEFFNAYENARVVLAAEAYYRQSYLGGGVDSAWNIRDRAMVEMIVDALAFHDEKLQQLGQANRRARAVVWAHNSHIGDDAASELHTSCGQVNVGHLVREVLGIEACYLVGLTTARGTVRAAHHWNGRDHMMKLHAPLQGSVGDVMYTVATRRGTETGQPDDASFGLFFRSQKPLSEDEKHAKALLQAPRLERFVGVQYHKRQERQAHYAQCRLSDQFDMVIHVDATTALRPLPESLLSEPHEPPATPAAVRPGTVDYSKWDRMFQQDGDDEDDEKDEDDKRGAEAMAVPP
jgi:erythromycin esterase-like protein